MHFGFQAYPYHIKRIPNPFLVVNNIRLGDKLKNLPVHRDNNRPRRFKYPFYIFPVNFPCFPVFTGNGYNAAGIDSVNVAAPNACPHTVDFPAAHHFRGFNGLGRRSKRCLNVNHDAFAQTGGSAGSHAGYFEISVFVLFADNGADLRRANVKADS
jgi:hypothetical protein